MRIATIGTGDVGWAGARGDGDYPPCDRADR